MIRLVPIVISLVLWVVIFFAAAELAKANTPPPPPPVPVGVRYPNTWYLVHKLVYHVFAPKYGRRVAHGMMVIAKCESGFNPHATNGQYRGIFQLSRSIRARMRELTGWHTIGYNIRQNVYGARYVYAGRGFEAWTCQP